MGRLLDARAALAAGRLDEGRALLEQAQVQSVLRPVGPSDNAASTGSVAAGQIAEALSMLGAGDVPRAMRYIDLAMAQARPAPAALRPIAASIRPEDREPGPPGYGYPSDRYGETISRQ
jgi:hypothetical protein